MNGRQKDLTGSLQVKRDRYVIYINFYDGAGKRRPKQIHTGLGVKGYNKRLAEDLKDLALHMLNNENADFENVKAAISIQAKVGAVPRMETGITVVEEKGEQYIQPVLTEEVVTTIYSHDVDGGTGSEPENPFIVPAKIMEIVNITPKPKLYTDSYLPGDSIPLVTYLRNWMSGQKHEVNHNTFASYEMQMNLRIIPFFSFFGLNLSDLAHTHVKMFYEYILDAPRLDGKSGKVSPTTVHRVHSVFHKALNDALDDDYVVANPVARVHPPREKPFTPQYYSADQISTFLRNATGDIAEIPLVLSFFFGTRRSETLGLKENAIDFGANIIYVNHTVTVGQRKYDHVKMDAQGLVKEDRTKSKKSNRALPVPEVFMGFLKRIVLRNRQLREIFGPSWNPDGYLCVTNEGKLIHPNTMSKHYKAVAKKAGLPVNRLHDARHSIASLMIQNGTDISVLKEYLGHADIQTTTRYAHLKTQHLVAPATKVQELIGFEGLSG
ncbi:site-specific integrase [Ruminococcaceae bacterium OttesenSCG-928-A11]|nr:site-specific integrase [Ruminococcaceae bacterium OttesenSCG-928-A11]